MMFFSIGNLCKEVQRIKFDIEQGHIESAMERCEGLDEFLCAIEEGKYGLKLDDVVVVK